MMIKHQTLLKQIFCNWDTISNSKLTNPHVDGRQCAWSPGILFCCLHTARAATTLFGIDRILSCPPLIYPSSIRRLSEFRVRFGKFQDNNIFI